MTVSDQSGDALSVFFWVQKAKCRVQLRAVAALEAPSGVGGNGRAVVGARCWTAKFGEEIARSVSRDPPDWPVLTVAGC